MTPLWQILIASVYARTDQLARLLAELSSQIAFSGHAVSVLVDRDDCYRPVGEKRTRLVEAATADYVCFVDDDDDVAGDYVHLITRALVDRPDMVGFNVAYTADGVPQKPVLHSLACGRWYENADGYYRDISHLNPLRRDAALAGLPFEPGFGEDKVWADRVRASGLVRTETFVPATLYRYRYSTCGSLFGGGPRRVGAGPGLPSFPYVEVLT